MAGDRRYSQFHCEQSPSILAIATALWRAHWCMKGVQQLVEGPGARVSGALILPLQTVRDLDLTGCQATPFDPATLIATTFGSVV